MIANGIHLIANDGPRSSHPNSSDTGHDQAEQALDKAAFPEGDATAEGISEEALQELVKRAQETNSNSLVVVKNGKLIGQWYFGHKIKEHPIRSITKSITSLAIGKLIDEHKIASLDVPIATFYPQWQGGTKAAITLRNILTQTSGLDERADNSQADLVKVALDAEVKDPPGTKFVYNDRVSNLLAGVVQKASGRSLDAYVAEKIFGPMAIVNSHWDKDGSGNPIVMSGLYMTAIDLAKLGHLIAGGGIWEGKQIVSPFWLEAATTRPTVNPAYGLMWWLIDKNAGKKEDSVEGTEIIGCSARGHLGQALIVMSKQKLVVVRQISEKSHKSESDNFNDLPDLCRALMAQK